MEKQGGRLVLLDTIRGITIISMIIFHACWDIMYIGFGFSMSFMNSVPAYWWQQSICYTFILLSGFCFSLGKHHIKRGLLALGGGIVITIVTCLVIYDARDIFGVLWLIGSSILLMCVIDRIIPHSKPVGIIGLVISFGAFFVTRNINEGRLGFESLQICPLPEKFYKGYLMTFLGFTDPGFYSSDYFSFIPWVFLFAVGYFAYMILSDKVKNFKVLRLEIKPLSFIGRHSLLIYMLHQPIVYGVLYLLGLLIRK